MNRSELIDSIAEKTGATKLDTDRMLSAFIDTVSENISTEGGVRISRFGHFKVSKRDARTGRNPQTGEEIQIPARNAPSFKPGSELKKWADK